MIDNDEFYDLLDALIQRNEVVVKKDAEISSLRRRIDIGERNGWAATERLDNARAQLRNMGLVGVW